MKKVHKNYSNELKYASSNKRLPKNVDNNISFRQSDDEDNNDIYSRNSKSKGKSPKTIIITIKILNLKKIQKIMEFK